MAHTIPERIFRMATKLLDDEHEREKMVAKSNPYGDGQAGRRIAELLMEAVGERVFQTV
jgi:UDP-N-acetylglucosamine 2-epimerase (non-hydrolysing)